MDFLGGEGRRWGCAVFLQKLDFIHSGLFCYRKLGCKWSPWWMLSLTNPDRAEWVMCGGCIAGRKSALMTKGNCEGLFILITCKEVIFQWEGVRNMLIWTHNAIHMINSNISAEIPVATTKPESDRSRFTHFITVCKSWETMTTTD